MNHNYFSSLLNPVLDPVYLHTFQPHLQVVNYNSAPIQSDYPNFFQKHNQETLENRKPDATKPDFFPPHPKSETAKKKKPPDTKPAEVITFEEQQQNIKNSPAYFLGLFIDTEIIDWLIRVAETSGRVLKNFSAPKEEEMRCFIAILYRSGYAEVPRRRMLWERSPDTHCALVSNAMQRDRFEAIFTALHSTDSSKEDVCFDKLKSLIEKLNVRFLQRSPVDDQHSIAEYYVANAVRHRKASKSLKMWCGCLRSGYCVNFTPGDESPARTMIINYADVVQRHNGSLGSLTFENVHSEVHVLSELQKLGVQPVGANRDKNYCVLNPSLGGVDRLETNMDLYRITIKGKKAYSTLLTFCLDVAMNNAWQLYKTVVGDKKPLALLGFRRSVVIYYLEHYARPILGHRGGRPSKVKSRKRHRHSDARFDGIRHYVVPQQKQTRCAKCNAKTTTRCQKCDVGVHVKCFVEFHVPKEL